MLHRNTLIAVCAIFCAVAVGAGLFVAKLSKQSGLITQQAGIDTTSLPTTIAGAEPTAIADLPTAASASVPTIAPIAVLDPADPTAVSQLGSTSAPAATATLAATSAPTATVAPTGNASAYIEYTVQKGDLLNSIAKKYNVTTKDILALNQISNADSLTVGQILRIPKV
jgi:LysM repeat protein